MTKVKKAIKNLPIIMIAVAMLLLWIIDTKSKLMNLHSEIIIIILFLFAILLDLYLDVKDRQYSTSKFVIIADVVEIITFIALCYLYFKSVDNTNTELLWKRTENIRYVGLVMILIPSIKSILKSQSLRKIIISNRHTLCRKERLLKNGGYDWFL